MRASLWIPAALALLVVPACEGEVRFPGDEAGDDDPCASRDEEECSDDACSPLYVGNTCDGPADYDGCVSRTRVGCTDGEACGRGATCEVLELGVCAGPPGAVTCLACGAAKTGVCSR